MCSTRSESRDIPAASGGKTETRQVWKYQAGRFVAIDVQSGLADDRWTEQVKGDLHPGDQLVTNASLDNTLTMNRIASACA